MQIFGGAGYLRGNLVERMYREVKVVAIGGGSEEIMRDLAVRQMGCRVRRTGPNGISAPIVRHIDGSPGFDPGRSGDIFPVQRRVRIVLRKDFSAHFVRSK